MSWWGKVIGGTLGLFAGGPIGALLGAALGHNLDQGMSRFQAGGGVRGAQAQVERIQSLFFTTTFSMMGYLSKADGQVSAVEIRVAEDVMRQMNLNADQKKIAIRLFKEGKKEGFPMDEVLEQFRAECQRRRNLVQMLMEILVYTALADGEFHAAERRILEDVADQLGFSKSEYQQIFDRLKAQQHFQQGGQTSKSALKDAYALLGIEATVSDDDVKKAYRRQMNQHHPDKLVAKGLPQEMIELANRKTQDIRTAYEMIKKHRAE